MTDIDAFLDAPIINYVHLHLQSRGGKKVTLIEGLVDPNGTLKDMRKKLSCGGSIQKSKNEDDIVYVQLQGDLRERVKNYLVSVGIKENSILIHGY